MQISTFWCSILSTAERKLYQENKAKAQEMLAAVQKAECDMVLLQEAQQYFNGLITSNVPVIHKAFGELEVVSLKGEYLSVRIKKTGETKTFVLLNSIANGFLKVAADDFEEKVAQYKAVMLRERDIASNLSSANKAFEPYKKYLD